MLKLREYLDGARGRRVALAAALNIRPGAISQWERVPGERVLDIERITGISRSELRPDLYPAPTEGEAA